MGVRGLETFIERDRYACRKVDIAQTVAQNRKCSSEPVVVVVDGCSCLLRLYRPLPWIPGGQLKEYEDVIERLIDRFRSLGVEPVFFFDGPLREDKVATWIKRKVEAVHRVEAIFDNIKMGISVENLEKDDRTLLVDNFNRVTIDTLKRLGCQVFNSVLECDEEIVKFASDNNCLAILGQDSDFLIYPGNWQYWSSKHLNLNEMTTVEYDRRRLAESLRLPRNLLPLWASLMGNDILHYDEVQWFHDVLRTRGYRRHRAFQVARFVFECASSGDGDVLLQIGRHLGNENVSRLLQDSVKSYDITREISPDPNTRCLHDKNWDEILQVVAKKHKTNDFIFSIYGIMTAGIYKAWESMEDYNNKDLPPNQKALKKLRQKIYGILLHERPRDERHVRELAVAGPGTFDRYDEVDVIPPRVHPGLLKLWDELGNAEGKWELFCSSIEVDSCKVRGVIPDVYVIPALSLLYLMQEGVKIKRWEVEAVVASIVTLASYSSERIRQLSVTHVDARSVHFYTLVTRTFGTLYTLNLVCGSPISTQKTYFSLYQDGKLFHVKYREAKNGATASELCENQAKTLENYRLIWDLLPCHKFIDDERAKSVTNLQP